MKRSDTSVQTSGIGIGGVLGVAFVILKLCGVIDWPWVWVLSPFWIPLGLAVLIVIAAVAVAVWKDMRDK